MNNRFLTNYSETSFLDYIITALNNCKSFYFSVSFIKKLSTFRRCNNLCT